MKPLRYRASSLSHEGRQRPRNEDSVLVHPSGALWAVADGMGGHRHGDFASQTAVAELARIQISGDVETDAERILRAVWSANREIFQRSERERATVGTTLAALYAFEGRCVCFWVGDSRIYRIRDGAIQRLTDDHTHLRYLIESGQIGPEQAKTHPMRHVLARALGAERQVRVETKLHDVEPDDVYVICSDGLTVVVPDDEILRAVVGGPIGGASERLVELSLSRARPTTSASSSCCARR